MFRYIILFFLLIFSYTSYSQNNEKNISIDLYPNPANEYINLKFENNRITDDDYDYSIHSQLIGNEMLFYRRNR